MNGAVSICISDRILPVLDSVPPSSCVSAFFCRVHSDQAARVGNSPPAPPYIRRALSPFPCGSFPPKLKLTSEQKVVSLLTKAYQSSDGGFGPT